MEACIISTAQQASPNVIHISEPVRAQLMRSSVVVTRKPLSASWVDTSVKPRVAGLHEAARGRAEPAWLRCGCHQSHSSAPLRHS